jgi:signal transduction histidine kinase
VLEVGSRGGGEITTRRDRSQWGDIARISGGVNQMRILLDELLELSRVGRLVNPPEPGPLADLVHEAILLVSGQITTGGVQVVVASELPIVYGDRHRLIEVVQNLLDNAVKFMGQQPEPRIEIGAKNIEAETLCYVRDNGMGISPQYHGKVFGLFDRLDQSVEGTGIGLALVKRIIEVHNGRIWVESEGKGKGSTFYFTLPTEMEQGSYGMSAPL